MLSTASTISTYMKPRIIEPKSWEFVRTVERLNREKAALQYQLNRALDTREDTCHSFWKYFALGLMFWSLFGPSIKVILDYFLP